MGNLATRSIGLLLFLAVSTAARTTLIFPPSQIPATISISEPSIMVGSDSLYLGTRLLVSGADYRWDRALHAFLLDSAVIQSADTLKVSYNGVPAWMLTSFGRDIPEVAPSGKAPEIPSGESTAPNAATPFAQTIKLSGAKTFRFSARNGGGSDFGQSIDLQIAGELSPGVELSGALSDRGYDPIYGTANSRLNELDKVNLQLKSRRVLVRMGDIVLPPGVSSRARSISGAMFDLHLPTWHVDAAAARPKGRFTTIVLTGENGFQGPYQVTQGTGLQPVVPGSETVWLDGRKLDRGADKDYAMDYPSGQITFSSTNPIDRRRRIEIDFEPASSTYRQELLLAGGGVNLRDSSLYFSVRAQREGDDKNQPLAGELSDEDKFQLQQAGDGDAAVSGVRLDSLGSYDLVAGSPPDSVYQFVGEKRGTYSITFTYMGPLRGSYRFLGSGDYQFVGEGKGDYLPIIVLPRPERRENYQATLGFRSRALGTIEAEIRQTRLDRNLWSLSRASVHDGAYYNVSWRKGAVESGRGDYLAARFRYREPEFQSVERLDSADFARRFMIPARFVATEREALGELSAGWQATSGLTIRPHLAQLSYAHGFDAVAGGVAAEFKDGKHGSIRSSWTEISSRQPNGSDTSRGRGDNFLSSVTAGLWKSVSGDGQIEYDRRRSNYTGEWGGTKFLRWTVGAGTGTERAEFERYGEDTLIASWKMSAVRKRLSLKSVRQFGKVTYDATAGWQWLDDTSLSQQTFLARTTIGYNDPRAQTQVTGSYALSSELRNARGISYLEVEQGRGNYSLVNGQYVPDVDGNYLQIEEILSDRAHVRRGEKSFLLSKAGKGYTVRFDANISEELLDGGKRTIAWLIPFYSDPGQQYLYLARKYNSDVRLFPVAGVYLVTVAASDDLERRTVGGANKERRDSKGSVTTRQVWGVFSFDQAVEGFRSKRDDYFSGAGNITGWRAGIRVKRSVTKFDMGAGLSYRQADSKQGETARTFGVTAEGRVQVAGRGDIGGTVELYTQKLAIISDNFSYQLTDNRYGKRGVLWTISYRYSIKTSVKVMVTMNGRHSNDRAGRVSGRAEMVAGF